MTEASKAEKKKARASQWPRGESTRWIMVGKDRAALTLVGVSVRAGVGGRRGERRRRARERAESRGAARMLAGAAWEMVTNPALQRPWKEKPLRDAFEDLRARLAAFTGQLRG